MAFCFVDKKKECFSVFHNGNMHLRKVPLGATKTWSFSPLLSSEVQLGSIYANSWSLERFCPSALKPSFEKSKKQMEAHMRAIRAAKISLASACLYDLIPKEVLVEFCSIKNEIIEHVFSNFQKPKNYEFMRDLLELLFEIANQKVNVNIRESFIHRKEPQVRRLFRDFNFTDIRIEYSPFSVVTGRLGLLPSSFPILNLKKQLRTIVCPQNDLFLELDYNAADLRTFLGLLDVPQPQIDLHQWNKQRFFPNIEDRKELKRLIFKHLYRPAKLNEGIESIYNRDQVVYRYWDRERKMLTTPFRREIPLCDRHLAISYVVQSSTSDLVLEQAQKIKKILTGKRSFISFLIHDNIVIDLAEDEKYLIPELVQVFSETRFGRYLVNTAVGKNFGEMKSV